ncbi:hypothetical protein LRR80_04881 [Streptomyces sp. RO-S4]|nr:hypothetical protein [Streptomyces sp. RO-S4]
MDESTTSPAPTAPAVTPSWPPVAIPGQGPASDPSSSERDRTDSSNEGAGLLDELRAAIARYVILPSGEALTAVTLWVAATHIQPALQHAPRLAVVGPAKRCGKSRLPDVITETAHDPLITVEFPLVNAHSPEYPQVSTPCPSIAARVAGLLASAARGWA